MTWRDTLRSALDAVRSHRLRSVLTMLGITIGIVAVTLSVGIGQGARAEVNDQIAELGTNVLVVSPGSDTDDSGVRGGSGSASTLTLGDAEALADPVAAPDVDSVAPTASTNGVLTAGEATWTTSLVGTTPSWLDVRSRAMVSGSFIDDDDLADAAAVVVLGSDTATELFGSTTAATGESVSYDGRTLKVVGVLAEVSSSEDTTNNDLAIVPSTTYSQRLVGGDTRDAVSAIYVKATSEETVSAAYQESDSLVANLHGISGDEEADYSIATQESILAAATSVDDTLTVMLAGIAVISLLVGGIGVMNIMLVSVTERIREIGLRKALGATPSLVRRQFLLEASLLGLAGGALGVGIGLVLSGGMQAVLGTRVVVSPLAVSVSLLTGVVVAVAFGVHPATRAARLTPIDALRSQ
ncbi:MAG: ABC transporter permease [Microthrixaceae bacterium]|nr:ABC transporter permease [Microthrixaceae bacterium]